MSSSEPEAIEPEAGVDAAELVSAIDRVEAQVVPRLMALAQRINSGDPDYVDMGEAVALLTYLKRYGSVEVRD